VARFGKNLPSAGALLLAVLVSANASAFCRTTTCESPCQTDPLTSCAIDGIPIAWPVRCVSYSVHADVPASIGMAVAKAKIDASFQTWQHAVCPGTNASASISVTDAFGPATCGHVEYNRDQANANVIMFRDETWAYENSDSALALTTVTFNVNTGDIYDVDMELNTPLLASDVPGPITGAYDLQSVVTHEAGHFLGLAHSEQAGATMLRTYEPLMQNLSDDDIAGICAVYPPDRSTGTCDPTPRMGFSPECAIDPVSGGCSMTPRRPDSRAILLLVALGGLLGRSRRRLAA
jgi:MYXO-CTERM domain-containing protein